MLKTSLKVNVFVQVKTGLFAEHSNQLWNISGVGYWGKVNEGLIKMYKAEVTTHHLKSVNQTFTIASCVSN